MARLLLLDGIMVVVDPEDPELVIEVYGSKTWRRWDRDPAAAIAEQLVEG